MKHARDHGEDVLSHKEIIQTLKSTMELENELLRTYAITAEAVQNDLKLQDLLHNLAEGNAKRVNQLEAIIEEQ